MVSVLAPEEKDTEEKVQELEQASNPRKLRASLTALLCRHVRKSHAATGIGIRAGKGQDIFDFRRDFQAVGPFGGRWFTKGVRQSIHFLG